MQNLDQIRAAAASKHLPLGENHPFDKSDLAGIPALILANGLLSTVAFCCEMDSRKPKRPGMSYAIDALAEHLKELHITSAATGQKLIEDLAAQNLNLTLQRATTESLAFFGYMKRFARPAAAH